MGKADRGAPGRATRADGQSGFRRSRESVARAARGGRLPDEDAGQTAALTRLQRPAGLSRGWRQLSVIALITCDSGLSHSTRLVGSSLSRARRVFGAVIGIF